MTGYLKISFSDLQSALCTEVDQKVDLCKWHNYGLMPPDLANLTGYNIRKQALNPLPQKNQLPKRKKF